MKSSALQAVFWVVLVFCDTVQTQPQTKTTRKEPASSVSGRVTINGKGALGIIVGLRAPGPFNRQTPVSKATTDQEGNYRITNLPPGTYQVMPHAPTFVGSGDRGGKRLIVAAGETVEGIDFTLNRGGVITGKATDSEGRPLIEEQIILLPVEENNQNAQAYMRQQRTYTDDRGSYRIFGIPQGKYRIALGQIEDVRGPRGSNYPPTFHPAVTDAAKATVIEVSEGTEATNVDITVGRILSTFTASGRIVDGRTGQALANIKYGLQTFGRDQGSFIRTDFVSDSKGEFKVEHLTPGKYAVFVVPQANNGLRADPVPFDLIDQDVTGLLLKTSQGASVSGVVLLEGTYDRSALARLSHLSVYAHVAKEGPGESWIEPAPIGSHDGSFRIGGLQSGMAHFSLSSRDELQSKGFMLVRVERDGIAQPGGVEIKEGEQVTGVRLVVTYGTGIIRGVIKVVNGELPATARLGVWITNRGDGPTTIPRNLPSPSVDTRGRFIVEGLPAGIYELNVAVNIPEPRSLQSLVKQQVNVADGEVTEVTINVELSPNPGAPVP